MIIEIRNSQGYVIDDFLYSKGSRSEAVKKFQELQAMTAQDWAVRAESADYAEIHVHSIQLVHEGEIILEHYPKFT